MSARLDELEFSSQTKTGSEDVLRDELASLKACFDKDWNQTGRVFGQSESSNRENTSDHQCHTEQERKTKSPMSFGMHQNTGKVSKMVSAN
eukprot:748525-Amphidinium_carterae.1